MSKKKYVVSYTYNGKRSRTRDTFSSKKQAQEFIKRGKKFGLRITDKKANPRVVNATRGEIYYEEQMKLIDKQRVARRK